MTEHDESTRVGVPAPELSDSIAGDPIPGTPILPGSAAPTPVAPPPQRDPAASDSNGIHHRGPLFGLALGAIGVVFGDIGTSPLYSLQTVFSLDHNAVRVNRGDVFGVLSLVFWSITIIVSIKYVALVMRADNDGEGGILALAAKIIAEFKGSARRIAIATLMAIVGAALFFGDSVITPAISVMSAVEGLAVQDPALADLVLPISVVILTGLFIVQRFGTHAVGRAFGPVMIVWFVVIGVMGIPSIVRHPGILAALSPHYAFFFWLDRPFVAFIAMGAVVLAITGAEALYADMGHFGARPIQMSWFFVIFPALLLNYFGQGAMILHDPSTISNPFFLMAPSWATIPLVILATIATVIASQAVISGAYSVAQQAIRLGLFPRMKVKHTSTQEVGQIYVPVVNWILYVGVLLLIAVFRSSARLATAYGLAVTGTLLLTTFLFLLLAREVWKWSWPICVAIGVVIGGLEFMFFAANTVKFISGGWLPLLLAGLVTSIMLIWRSGARRLRAVRAEHEGPLSEFVDAVRSGAYPRVPGTAIFPHPGGGTTPLALKSNMQFNHIVHEKVLLVTIVNEKVPHIRHVDRVSVQDLGYDDVGIMHMTVRVGFKDSQDVPKGVITAAQNFPEIDIDPATASYFLSVLTVRRDAERRGLPALVDSIFVWMTNNQADPPQVYRLPPDRTVVMGEQIQL